MILPPFCDLVHITFSIRLPNSGNTLNVHYITKRWANHKNTAIDRQFSTNARQDGFFSETGVYWGECVMGDNSTARPKLLIKITYTYLGTHYEFHCTLHY